MTNPIFAEDDDGFLGYVETSHDPGSSLIFATVLFCIISYCSLPLMIAMSNRLDVKNQQSTPRCSKQTSKKQQLDLTDDAVPLQADDASVVSERSAFSLASIVSLHSHRTRKRRNYRNRRTMEKRHDWEEFELRMQRYDSHCHGDYPFDEVDDQTRRGQRSASPERSVLGQIDQDEVSIDDAVSQAPRSPNRRYIPIQQNTSRNPDDASPESSVGRDSSFLDALLDLVTWDFESKRIIKLAIPFATQALSTGVLESFTVAVIGKMLGTKEVSAFVLVRTLTAITSSFFGGCHEALATLCAQAIGRHNYKLVGQYVQLSMIFYVVCYIPFIFIWWAYIPSILLWFGFDAETAQIGKEYTQVGLLLPLTLKTRHRLLICNPSWGRFISSWSSLMVWTNLSTDCWM